jgi:PBP1b-binding outer membrane lipoprotein LpoB
MKRYCKILLPLLPLALLFAGCEPDENDVRGELPVTPASTTLRGDQDTVILTADVSVGGANPDPIVYPLKWSVSNPAAGYIAALSANSAAYTHVSRKTTSNVITVRDGLARKGVATVHWSPAEADSRK